MKTVGSEWVPAHDGLPNGYYIARGRVFVRYEGCTWTDMLGKLAAPKELLAVNGQIVRVS